LLLLLLQAIVLWAVTANPVAHLAVVNTPESYHLRFLAQQAKLKQAAAAAFPITGAALGCHRQPGSC
jgi:hypothetical protein